jgi:hypothetical protein
MPRNEKVIIFIFFITLLLFQNVNLLPRINQIGIGKKLGVDEGKDPWKIDFVVSSD